jgi:DNA-binding transcriptional MerR regulator
VESTPERDDSDELLPPRQAVTLFGVTAQSLRNWHAAGLLAAQRTAGGHRRYRKSEVRALIAAMSEAVA